MTHVASMAGSSAMAQVEGDVGPWPLAIAIAILVALALIAGHIASGPGYLPRDRAKGDRGAASSVNFGHGGGSADGMRHDDGDGTWSGSGGDDGGGAGDGGGDAGGGE
jgi:hypothetical protein